MVVESADVSVGTHLTAAVGQDMSATCGGTAKVTAVGDALIKGFGNVDVAAEKDIYLAAGGSMTFKDSSVEDAVANVDEIIKDIVDGRGNLRKRVDANA